MNSEFNDDDLETFQICNGKHGSLNRINQLIVSKNILW